MRARGFSDPVLIVALVAVLVHAGSLRGEFLEWDDALLVSNNPPVVEGGFRDLGDLLNPWEDGGRRHYGFEYLPVRDLSNRVDRLYFGLNPMGYHLGNVLLFGVAAAALYGVLLVLLRDRRAALLGALLYAVHPGTTESVACIAHRKDVLMAAFALLAWLAWLKERRVLALLLFATAVLSKLPAIALPILILIADAARGSRFDRLRVAHLGGLFAIAGAAAAIAMSIAPALGRATWHGGTPFTNALSVGVAFLESVRLLVLPIGLHVGRVNETMTRTAPDVASLVGLVLLLGLLVLGVRALLRQRRRPTTGGLVLVVSTLGLLALQAPYLQLRPFWVLFAERYLILALVPVALAGGLLVIRFPGRGPTRIAVVALGLLAVHTFVREADWKNTETLFTDAYEKEPRSYVALEKVGRMKALRGELAEGRDLLRRAIAAAEGFRSLGQAHLEEILVSARENVINSNVGLGRLDEARAEADIWAHDRPESALARAFQGYAAQAAGRRDEARARYREAIELAGDRGVAAAMSHHNLGIFHQQLEGPTGAAAIAEFERAVKAEPSFVRSWLELARGHTLAGRWEKVVEAYEHILVVEPRNLRILRAITAVLDQKLGRGSEARLYRMRIAALR